MKRPMTAPQVERDRVRLQKQIAEADLRQWVESDRQEDSRVAHRSDEVELRERADRRDAKAESLETETAQLREQIKQRDQQERQIRDQMLEP